MTFFLDTLTSIEALTREAGAIVRVYHDRADTVAWKGNDDPVTAADHAVNAYLVEGLSRLFPADGILAEESEDNPDRLERGRVWCVDPLDGTKEFIARNGEFSIMVGLAEQGEAVLGVVYQPIIDLMYSGIRDVGAWLTQGGNRGKLDVSAASDPTQMRLVVSRSHRNPIVDDIKRGLGIQQERISGSVGLKCGLIARAEADLYLHPSPGVKEWDTCAPEAILRGAGGVMTDCWGQSLRYNQRDVHRRHGIVASNGRCHSRIISVAIPILTSNGLTPSHAW